jgi:hypothetical protein
MAITYATALGCPQLNCLLGKLPAGVSPEQARKTTVENLRFAAGSCRSAGIMLLIEPINHFDIPGFFLNAHRAGAVDHRRGRLDNLLLQYDIYHAQRMEGELAATITKNMPRSAISSSPTTRAATSPAPARSTTPSCSSTRCHRLHGLDRLRIQAQERHRQRPRLAHRPHPITTLRQGFIA